MLLHHRAQRVDTLAEVVCRVVLEVDNPLAGVLQSVGDAIGDFFKGGRHDRLLLVIREYELVQLHGACRWTARPSSNTRNSATMARAGVAVRVQDHHQKPRTGSALAYTLEWR